MLVAIGSTNSAKVNALKNIAPRFGFSVVAQTVPSNVSAQPRSDEETIRGARNRARNVIAAARSEIGIGLEGGITEIDGRWYICNWGVLVDKHGYECISSGGHFQLPTAFLTHLDSGKELREVVQMYQNESAQQNDGAISLLTNGNVTRQKMYEQLLSVLFGQYEIRNQFIK